MKSKILFIAQYFSKQRTTCPWLSCTWNIWS